MTVEEAIKRGLEGPNREHSLTAARLCVLRATLGVDHKTFWYMLCTTDTKWRRYELGLDRLPTAIAGLIFDAHGVDLNWLYLGYTDNIPKTLLERLDKTCVAHGFSSEVLGDWSPRHRARTDKIQEIHGQVMEHYARSDDPVIEENDQVF